MDSGPVVSMIFRADSISYLRNMVSQDGKTQKKQQTKKNCSNAAKEQGGHNQPADAGKDDGSHRPWYQGRNKALGF